jgi:hypothetical protein
VVVDILHDMPHTELLGNASKNDSCGLLEPSAVVRKNNVGLINLVVLAEGIQLRKVPGKICFLLSTRKPKRQIVVLVKGVDASDIEERHIEPVSLIDIKLAEGCKGSEEGI